MLQLQTTHNPGGRPTLDPHRDYALRRAAIRSTWLAHDEAGDASSLAAGAGSSPQRAGGWRRHVLVRFVVGRVPVDQEGHAAAAAALQAEAEAFGDFMRLPDVEVSVRVGATRLSTRARMPQFACLNCSWGFTTSEMRSAQGCMQGFPLACMMPAGALRQPVCKDPVVLLRCRGTTPLRTLGS